MTASISYLGLVDVEDLAGRVVFWQADGEGSGWLVPDLFKILACGKTHPSVN
ncbi:MAG: hypothetical protein ACI9UA_002613 [Pseudoalteromonas tetraodonis]|jgi:hypothetical protein